MSGSSRKRGPQRALERLGVRPHLALVDQAPLVVVHELDRVFDRDDVVLAVAVDVVDHRAQRGRLARPGRTGHEHQALVQPAEVEDGRRQPELLRREDLRGDDAEHPAAPLAVHEDVGAEARQPRYLVGKIGVVPLLEFLTVARRHDRIDQRREPIIGQGRCGRIERHDLSVLADQRRHADAQMQVGRAQAALRMEQPVDGRRRFDDRGRHAASTSLNSSTCRKLTTSSASGVSRYRNVSSARA